MFTYGKYNNILDIICRNLLLAGAFITMRATCDFSILVLIEDRIFGTIKEIHNLYIGGKYGVE